MRVGIDASNMLISQKTGIERYVTALILAVIKLLPDNPDVELILYFHSGNKYADPALLDTYLPNLAEIRRRVYKPRRGYRLALSAMTAVDGLDLLHIPSPVMLRFVSCPILLTFHDASWAHLPEEGRAIEGEAGRESNERAIAGASAFIAVSENAKTDLMELYGVYPQRVWVVHHGVDERYRRDEEATQAIRCKYKLGPYILNVAALQYRKNQVRLVEAFARLRQQHLIPHDLVIAGREGWGFRQVYDRVAELDLGDHVRFLGYVPEEDLPGLYAAAALLAFPSLHEGFGMPLLEAMACGTVVVASNRSSLPEVAGDAALYFDPYDVDQIVAVIHRALTDASLRGELQARGLQRVKQFTWEDAARRTLDVYREMLRDNVDRQFDKGD